MGNLQGDIEFKNVSFHYEDNKEKVLNHINLKVHAGEYMAGLSAFQGDAALLSIVKEGKKLFVVGTKESVALTDKEKAVPVLPLRWKHITAVLTSS